MKLPKALSKERIGNGLKSFGKLRIKVSHSSIITFAILLIILLFAFVVRVFPLRWEIETGAVHLSEFDPYYQYSLTKYMVQNGLISPYWPTQWVDKQRWYPDGINMANSFPSLPMTAAFFYNIISALGVNVDLMTFCAFFPAVMGALACLIIYFLGKDMGGKTVGMFSAMFLAISPSFIQRTSLGFFDDETIGIVALLLFILLFLRSIETDRPIGSTIKYSLGSALALAYFCTGWGAAFYPIGLTVLFIFALILLKRYTSRLLLSYSIIFGLGLFIAMSAPINSINYLTASAILPVGGVFVLLLLSEVLRSLTSARSKVLFTALFLAALVAAFALLWNLGYLQDVGQKFWSVINPLVRENVPLIESVAEHRISSWGSIYYEFSIGIIFFIAALYFTLRNPNNNNLFLLLFGLTSLYFAGSMARLLVLMAPAFSILASTGVLGVLKPFVTLLREPPKIVTKARFGMGHVGKEFSGIAVFLIFLVLMTNFSIAPQSGGIPKPISQAYIPVTITAGSIPIAPNKPVSEWFDMLTYLSNLRNTSTVVCSWWDYGYWLALIGNVTSLADNATINFTQIENIGFIFMANESQALKMLKLYNAKYILVFTTIQLVSTGTSGEYAAAWIGYGDEGKWMWMARISGKARERFIQKGLLDETSAWSDENMFGNYTENAWTWYDVGKNATIYKLMSWAKQRWCDTYSIPSDVSGVKPTYFKETFFSGLSLSPNDMQYAYGNIVPLVSLYEVDWQKYYTDYPNPT